MESNYSVSCVKRLFSISLVLSLTVFSLFTNLPTAKAESNVQPLISKIEVNNGKMDPYNANIHRYRIDLDLDEELPSISIITANSDVKYEIANLHQLKPNDQTTLRVIAYDNLGNSDVYLLDVVSKSSDTKSLIKYFGLTNGILSPKFDNAIHYYYALVENNQSSLALQIQTTSPLVEYKIYNNDDLPVGKRSEVVLDATDELGHQELYYISTYRKSELTSQISNDLVLSSISLNDATIPIEFNPWTFSYDIVVKNSIDDVKVNAIAQNASDNVRIYGNSHLQKNVPNIINILVTTNDDQNNQMSIYTLNIKKVSPLNVKMFTYAQMIVIGCLCLVVGAIVSFAIGGVRAKKKSSA